ncbi:MAG TPA: zf-TFIIB domain-containing protein [Rhodocyclaceae bacterium]|nr:zf-TFIIB domain-containing protein [Rhodocyclaceae bacterium]
MDYPTLCPSCRHPMRASRFERRPLGTVELDLCFSCQGIWFDEFESVQITPGGVIELFKLIHEHRDDQRLPLRDVLQCPRCDEPLLHGLDVAKGGRFNYHRCLQRHGRFTTFSQLMIEKGFVRQLSPREIDELKARVQVVRCASCGAPVDISQDNACGHCRSPISILDPEAVEQALASYHQAEVKRTTPNPEALADAILLAEKDRSRRQRDRDFLLERDVGDLVVSGVELVWNLLKR